MTICIYGNFTQKEIKVKQFTKEQAQHGYIYSFQNILRDAGYDAELVFLTDEQESDN